MKESGASRPVTRSRNECFQHVEGPLRATTNIPYPRPVRLRVVPIASTQTFSLSQTPPARVPSVPVPTGPSSCHSHHLQLRLHKKKTSKLRTALECTFHAINNNLYVCIYHPPITCRGRRWQSSVSTIYFVFPLSESSKWASRGRGLLAPSRFFVPRTTHGHSLPVPLVMIDGVGWKGRPITPSLQK